MAVPGSPRPYVMARAKTKGRVHVHQIGSRLYFEIPASEIVYRRDDRACRTPPASASTERSVRPSFFERRENRVFVRDINFNNVATALPRRAMALIEDTRSLPHSMSRHTARTARPSSK
jgi:hypothetical protein